MRCELETRSYGACVACCWLAPLMPGGCGLAYTARWHAVSKLPYSSPYAGPGPNGRRNLPCRSWFYSASGLCHSHLYVSLVILVQLPSDTMLHGMPQSTLQQSSMGHICLALSPSAQSACGNVSQYASIRQVALGSSLQEPDRVLPTCEICTQEVISR